MSLSFYNVWRGGYNGGACAANFLAMLARRVECASRVIPRRKIFFQSIPYDEFPFAMSIFP
jgi:hypothetical protein